MPVSMRFGSAINGRYSILDRLQYKYDNCGNISEIRENGLLKARYGYDDLNRIVREDNKDFGKTWLYCYDYNGNILSKKEYAFTLEDYDKLEELDSETIVYGYYGDRLISFGEQLCDYDILGNPTLYRDNKLSWSMGRRLVGYGSIKFAYDGQGKRISKGDISFTYDSNGKLLKQSNGLSFIYDNAGVVGLKYNGSTYIYRKDVQGNIIAILDSTGNVVVEYMYDAWGNHAVQVLDEECAELSQLNPFRYRGYYYDTETGLYFLKTRYYDPEIGRFITIDDLSYLDPETINGLNLYAYCGNNPVMCVDPNGTLKWWQNLLIALGGIALIAGLAIATVATGGAAAGLAGAICAGALKGAIIGGAIGTALGAGIGYAVGGIEGMFMGMAIGFTGGALIGAVVGGAVGGMGYSPLNAASNAANKAKIGKGFNINKHLNHSGGKYSKFLSDSVDDIVSMTRNGLKSSDVLFKTNSAAKSWQIIVDMGQVIGTKGQTAIKVILGYGGKIWTMFPIFL